MSYTVSWEEPCGVYARVTDWVTPELAARVTHELTSDPRYDDLRYTIVDLTESPGHTFHRGNRTAGGAAIAELIGARFTNPRVIDVAIATDPRMLNFLATYARIVKGPFEVFATLIDARDWLSQQTMSLRKETASSGLGVTANLAFAAQASAGAAGAVQGLSPVSGEMRPPISTCGDPCVRGAGGDVHGRVQRGPGHVTHLGANARGVEGGASVLGGLLKLQRGRVALVETRFTDGLLGVLAPDVHEDVTPGAARPEPFDSPLAVTANLMLADASAASRERAATELVGTLKTANAAGFVITSCCGDPVEEPRSAPDAVLVIPPPGAPDGR